MRAAPVSVLAASLALAPACGGSGGSSAAFVWEQSCAACHALGPGQESPNPKAPNLADVRPTREEVRRAIIDGRKGMPKGLVGGDTVDKVAGYVVEKTAR